MSARFLCIPPGGGGLCSDFQQVIHKGKKDTAIREKLRSRPFFERRIGLAKHSNPTQRDVLDTVVGGLAQDQAGALAGGQDVLVEVLLVDAAPDAEGLLPRRFGAQVDIAVEVGG